MFGNTPHTRFVQKLLKQNSARNLEQDIPRKETGIPYGEPLETGVSPVAKSKPAKKKRKRKKLTKKQKRVRKSWLVFSVLSGVILMLMIGLVIYLRGIGDRNTVFAPFTSGVSSNSTEKYNRSSPATGSMRVVLERGLSARAVCKRLEEAGVIQKAVQLEKYLIAQGMDTHIESGTYEFLPFQDISQIALYLVRGYTHVLVYSIYPGMTLSQINGGLVQRNLIQGETFIQTARSQASSAGYDFAEGYFFPGEYTVPVSDSLAEIVSKDMLEQFSAFSSRYAREIEASQRKLSDIVIVASMIQRETANPAEMPYIADIIWKRLDDDMPLGIDATTRYELQDWENPLQKKDLEKLTPYNTRRKTGLPPTGIANPGPEALLAAMQPVKNPYYYYLHDTYARIHYAETYEEHLQNVKTYLR